MMGVMAGKPALPSRNVHQRKLAVMARCGAIVPDKTHALKFDYLSIQTVSNHLREFCVEEGLDVQASIGEDLELSLINADDPRDRSVTHWPIVANDKGFAYTVKFPLVRLFLIGDGDENDEADMANQPAQLRKPKPPKPAEIARAVDEIDRAFGPAPEKRPGAFSHAATGHPEKAQSVGRVQDDAATPAPSEVAPEAAELLYRLADSLPKTPQTRPQIDGLLKSHGFEAILNRLSNAHKLQCGSQCAHLKAELELVLKP